ncbi:MULTISPECIES: APC family permease [unclassified Paenibacillus]|uniref:APC family permease n=1 Tax=unclassified Paenibacillus TaxID=185978 RepID=UPI002406B2A3|nr:MULTISPECIES: APC family permease [unclassified Paenibacillus]MDF9842809.1 amino acid transporter [Paenibacillus sp. PastF-2]MDF9849323.1 amino acid transporter [Paenibacillus sp. PastM-2]MDF9855969.1 amino acid transporter [Paenibacillus sp. PastF-1]MDH6481164.1 amino acid transporter [Paenibacillus sp. PastH-2]MDH6508584.1 amino acid transporter [Paenibacillus sp. PastM-3]
MISVKRLLIGRPLKSEQLGEQKLNKTKALAILSSDALSSVAYGPEQILLVLITVSAAAFWYSIPIAIGVLILLTALILSYRQIIYAYPQGGGAYVVSKENLGKYPGLIAGGSLLVDYILTVAVSVSAGTDAITSAFPSLHPYNVPIAILFVLLITTLNLRGLTESASFLAYPVYLFVLAIFIMLGVGLFRIVAGDVPAEMHTPVGTPVAGISLFLLLRAFASGSSALTGVEAISNAIPNFKAPAPNNAAKTLAAMGILLAVLFSGIVLLAYYYGVTPNEQVTVVSEIAEQVFGRNIMYFFIQGTTALILILAANTGYSAFPLLAVNLAKDKFIPRMFTVRGDRLGYSNGILSLGVLSILLIIAFEGRTEHLIPLYAVGVFIPFTLSQTGMMVKWIREKPPGWAGKLAINTTGALISFVVTIMFFLTKFTQVWPVLVFLPLIILLFYRIRKHYEAVADQLRLSTCEEKPLAIEGNVIILPVAGITHVVENSLRYAQSLSASQIIAVHVPFEREEEHIFEGKWKKFHPEIRLVSLYSPYRSIIHPLIKFIDTVQRKASESHYQVTVIVPQFIPKKGWHNILHNQSSLLIRTHLLYRRNVIITTVPYHLKK